MTYLLTFNLFFLFFFWKKRKNYIFIIINYNKYIYYNFYLITNVYKLVCIQNVINFKYL